MRRMLILLSVLTFFALITVNVTGHERSVKNKTISYDLQDDGFQMGTMTLDKCGVTILIYDPLLEDGLGGYKIIKCPFDGQQIKTYDAMARDDYCYDTEKLCSSEVSGRDPNNTGGDGMKTVITIRRAKKPYQLE